MSTSLYDLIPELQPYAEQFVQDLDAAGLRPRVTSTLRTRAEQERLYRRYLSGVSRLPAAPPGASAHEYGWAFDLVVSPDSAQSDAGQYWSDEFGGFWGSRRDPVHFEIPGATAAAKSALRQQIVDAAPSGDLDSPWWNPQIVPAWMMDALKLVPHYTTVRDLLYSLGMPAGSMG